MSLETDADMKKRVSRANMAAYDSNGVRDYVDGAPHIKHDALRHLYSELLIGVFKVAQQRTRVPRVLDLGAGEGSVTLPMLELGAHVTAVDISPDQLSALQVKCAKHGERLVVRCGDIADLPQKGANQFEIIVANSFLHHIPDYLEMLRGLLPRLSSHGQFFSFQDPLLYSSQSRLERLFDKGAYAFWRLGRDDVWNGLWRRWRRARGIFSPDSTFDNAEFHVLRAGVDQVAIADLFSKAGFDSKIISYFSTQNRTFQSIGTYLGMKNTFAFVAVRRVTTGQN